MLASSSRLALHAAALSLVIGVTAQAQDRLKSMPGYDQYQRMLPLYAQAMPGGGRGFSRGGVSATWSADGKSVDYTNGGKRLRYDIATKAISEVTEAPPQT